MFETLLGGRSTISRLVFIQSLDTGSQRLNRIVSSTSQIRAAVFSPHAPGFPLPVAYTSAKLTLIVEDY